MTPEDLRRLAERRLAESRSTSADADRLRVEAASLSGLLEPLVAMSREVWVGPAAAEFEAALGRHGSTLADQANRLVRLAGELDDRVTSLRSEASSLREQAAVAEAAENMALVSPLDEVV